MLSEDKTDEEGHEVLEIDDIETISESLAEEKNRAEGFLTNWKRTQADFINYKRRSEQEKAEASNLARSALILTLLPVLDDLERALASVPSRLAKHSWVEGVSLVERKFRTVLELQGVSEIKALGEPFDPELHEAAMHEKGEEGIVIRELLKGYKIGDRVIRPAGVVVGSGQEDA